MNTIPETSTVTPSSGNVFEDIGSPEPTVALIKATLIQNISRAIQKRELTQAQAAKILDVDQPKVSALLRGNLTGFSVERLIRFAERLDLQTEIRISEL